VTIALTDMAFSGLPEDVYPPQQDSYLLIEAMVGTGLAKGRRVADLCTGSGVVAIAAAATASRVTAFDICPRAVHYARHAAAAAKARMQVHLGSWARAREFAPFDLVVANPPYVPHAHDEDIGVTPAAAGPPRAWNAGLDGRLVLDPLCACAPELLAHGGTLLLVQSELADVAATLSALNAVGMPAEVVAQQSIPFGPVLSARTAWLERTGQLPPGRRVEELVVIRAGKP
jgi:release factor glutamine methyltransferase